MLGKMGCQCGRRNYNLILVLIAKEFTKGGHRKKVKRKSDHHMLVHIRWYFGTNLFDGIRFPIYVYHVTMFFLGSGSGSGSGCADRRGIVEHCVDLHDVRLKEQQKHIYVYI